METKKEERNYFNKKIIFLIALLLALFLIKPIILQITQNIPSQKQPSSTKNQEKTENSSLDNPSNSIQSTFEGFLPCIDCDGILTQITITSSSDSPECLLMEEYQNIQETEEQGQVFKEKVPCEIIERQEGQENKKILQLNPQKQEDLREFLFLDEKTLLEITPNQLVTEAEEVEKEDNLETKKETSYFLKKISIEK